MSAELVWGDLLVWSAQIAVITVVAAALLAILRLREPAVRLLFWHVTIAACLLLPLIRPWRTETGAAAVTMTTSAIAIVARAPAHRWTLPPLAVIMLGLIAAGAALRIAGILLGLAKLRGYRLNSTPYESGGSWGAHADIRISASINSPVTFGYGNPVVLLPPGFGNLAPEMREAILCHEILHVWRRDWLWTLAEEFVRAVFWFHPCVWWTLGEAQLAREQAVDRLVIEVTGAREGYVDALLAVAGAAARLDLAPAPLFLRRRHLKQRVVSILKEVRMSKTRLVSTFAAGAALLAGACWMVTGALPLKAAPQDVADAPGVIVQTGSVPLMHRSPVVYPQEGIAKGVQGNVVVQARLGADGSVVDASVLSGPDELRKAALESVLNWHFDRSAAGTTQQVSIDFALPQPQGSTTPATVRPVGPARAMAVLSALPPGESSVIQGIEVSGLSENARSQLLAQMPVHEGDSMTMADAAKITSAVRAFDSHLMVQFNSTPAGMNIRVQPQMPPVLMTNGAMTLAIPRRELGAVSLSAAPNAIHVGGQVQQANLISQVRPVYPPEAKAARVQGAVQFEATIGPDGRVENLVALSGPPLLVSAALESAKQWVYKPTLLNGNPVRVITTITINFTLAQ